MANLEISANGFIAMALNAGHKIIFHTILPSPGNGWSKAGKDYVWLKDLDGTIYLERVVKHDA